MSGEIDVGVFGTGVVQDECKETRKRPRRDTSVISRLYSAYGGSRSHSFSSTTGYTAATTSSLASRKSDGW
jgi:hypothetical protein